VSDSGPMPRIPGPLAESRRRFEQDLERLKEAVGQEVGRRPHAPGWIGAGIAVAVGVAMAVKWKGLLARGRREPGEGRIAPGRRRAE
jgi:hypothetical protein